MKTLKKLILSLSAFILLMTALIAASAFSASANSNGVYDYNIDSNGYAVITGYCGEETSTVTVPNDIDGYTVKKIKFFCNINEYGPNSYKTIRKIIISEGITKIDSRAFKGMNIYELVLPNSLTTIGENAFDSCDNLYSVKFGNSIKTISDYAFADAPIEKITLPKTVTYIGTGAFKGNNCTEITIHANVQKLGNMAFSSETIKTVYYNAIDAKPYDKNYYYAFPLDYCENLKTLVVGEGVINLPKLGAKYLTSVKLPSTLISIDGSALNSDTLKKIAIPYSVKTIGDNAFNSNTIIYGKKGGVANKYANENGNKFVNNDVTQMTFYYNKENVYTGKAIYPKLTVTNLGYTPTAGTDYTVAYSNNVKIGTGKITVTGKGDFIGKKTLTFVIGYDMTKAKVTLDKASYVYSPNGVRPDFTVTYSGDMLFEGSDFTVTYKNNKKVGTASIIFKGKGEYVGEKTVDFKICYDIEDAKITLSKSVYTYNSKGVKPSVTVKYSNKKLKEGTDYTVSYKNNKKAGSATAIINGKGSYAGEKSIKFKICYDISKAKVTFSKSSYAYSSKGVKPSMTVKYSDKKLKSGTDYTVTYKNNTKAGQATAVITGKGNYTGKIEKKFTIAPGKVQSVKVKLYIGARANTELSWKSISNVSGYEVYRATSKNGKYKKIGDTDYNGFDDYDINYGTYYYKVRAFVKDSGKTVYGPYSDVKSIKA